MKKLLKKSLVFAVAALSLCAFANGAKETKDGVVSSGKSVAANVKKGSGKAIVGDIPCTFPIVDKPLTLNVMLVINPKYSAPDNYVWKEYEKMTGIKVNFTEVPNSSSARKEKIATALASEEPLDLILRGKVSASTLQVYGDQGMIIDFMENDMLKKYAPNCYAYLMSHPDTLASVMNPDGSIYALPQVNSGAELRVSRKLFFNKKWLERVGMNVPRTTEELYKVLKAFKEKDANGNGNPNDEVPLCNQDWAATQDVFFGAFGISNRGQQNQVVDCDEKTGKARLIAASDGYKKMLQYLNRLYKEGLLDNEIFTMTAANWTVKAADDRIGCFAFTNLAPLPGGMSDNWVPITTPLEGPDGDKLWAPIRANFHSTGNAVIPATCKHIPEVLKWLDYFWTDEGTLFYHYGVEGKTFVKLSDGTYDFVDSIKDEMKNNSFDDIAAKYVPYVGGSNPTVEIAPYFGGGEVQPIPAAAARALFPYGPKEYWPSFTFTSDESAELNPIQVDINKYTTSARSEFITGTKSFDTWDAYIKGLKNMKLDTMLGIYQNAIDRYHELIKK